MRAVILHEFGRPVEITTVADPVAGAGDVVVDVVATGVLPYTGEVLSGARRYALTLPVIPGPGAVGRVRSAGPDATRLAPGDWVLVDPTVRSRDGGLTPDITLQGWSARGDGGLVLQRYFGNGAFAEQVLAPAENVFPIGDIDPADAPRWVAAGVCLVPYGGLRAGELRPGETVLVSGATGNYGSIAIAVALAMGAGIVVAPGRNADLLDALVRRFGTRVRPVRLTGDEGADRAAMLAAAGPVDLVLDLLPPQAPAAAARAAAMTAREHGRVVLMGGVGMLGGDDLALPYPWLMRNSITVRGQWMYPPAANTELIRMVATGLLDLSLFDVTTFSLDETEKAVADAAAHARNFHLTTICPR
ncbi:alcohol dehydrogenase catalytic domain-containing protein [Actinoplanes friuliensis]|uniref:Alcohol dehydrogenase zinc-binding domain-containing protein n=1 Tax=Actinoplanes friuliensis DSM 7358 TaxID=1246995 RepID=U5VVU5_9ACTN|nr:zinc-binding alcohol dehydrogenase family protein [Actinoplanes friuliensis]AGZ41078.1 alcohol dehydrogenase zinc-binding domain-containing protein [Actinoplanes friuliensis DSM 7358]